MRNDTDRSDSSRMQLSFPPRSIKRMVQIKDIKSAIKEQTYDNIYLSGDGGKSMKVNLLEYFKKFNALAAKDLTSKQMIIYDVSLMKADGTELYDFEDENCLRNDYTTITKTVKQDIVEFLEKSGARNIRSVQPPPRRGKTLRDYFPGERASKIFYSRQVIYVNFHQESNIYREYIFSEDFTPEKAREVNTFYKRLLPFKDLHSRLAAVLERKNQDSTMLTECALNEEFNRWHKQVGLGVTMGDELMRRPEGDDEPIEEEDVMFKFEEEFSLEKGRHSVEFILPPELRDMGSVIKPFFFLAKEST